MISRIELFVLFFFFCKQKTAYEMRISDWSSDVCSSDLQEQQAEQPANFDSHAHSLPGVDEAASLSQDRVLRNYFRYTVLCYFPAITARSIHRSEEHTSELQSLMRISYAVFCLKKKTTYASQKTHIKLTNPLPTELNTIYHKLAYNTQHNAP